MDRNNITRPSEDQSSSARTALCATIGIFLITGCGSETPKSQVFVSTNKECLTQARPQEYLAAWKDGRVTIVHEKDVETLMDNFITPHADELLVVEPHLDLDMSPAIENSSPGVEYEVLNWGAERIAAQTAWERGIWGNQVIVAVLDTAIDQDHPALKDAIYQNPGEIGRDDEGRDRATNGVDDDSNGFVDDVSGWDFVSHSPRAATVLPHGTHVAGILAAQHQLPFVSANEVQGIAPRSEILPVSFLDESGGTILQAVTAIDYAVAMGAKVINASWGGGPCSVILGERIRALADRDVLFVNAAGNRSQDLDDVPEFPAAHALPSQITVGSIGLFGSMASHSNFGDHTVHLFAPGFAIVSLIPNGKMEALTGTSMATPFVSGAAALLASYRPELPMRVIRSALLASVMPSAEYRNMTRGHVHVGRALTYLDQQMP